MPVTEAQFNRGMLWPPSNHRWMAPGAVQSIAAMFGPGLDYGALRVQNGIWEIIVPRTPTANDARNSEWIPFAPKNASLMLAANAFNRYGQGWSYGPGHNQHDEVITYFQEVNGRLPTDMEKLDIEHDKWLYTALLKAYQEKIGFTPPTGGPTTPPPAPPLPPVQPPILPPVLPPPAPPAPPVHPFSPSGVRADELWSLARPPVRLLLLIHRPALQNIDQKLDQIWTLGKPLAVALIEAWRRRK